MATNRLYLAVPSPVPQRFVGLLLFASVSYLAVLSLLNAQGIVQVSSPLVGVSELLIYAAAAVLLLSHTTRLAVVAAAAIGAWLCVTWAFRGGVDAKAARDLLIPLLFLSLGQTVASSVQTDRLVKVLLLVVVGFGLIEVFFLEWYAQTFNTFQFYVNTGATLAESAMFEEQMLTLNGFRPEGIGRTILPGLLGPHRASSLLMEPVSLGNFAVLILAYALSRDGMSGRQTALLVAGCAVLVAIADSRFGMLMMIAMIGLRLLPVRLALVAAAAAPLLCIVGLMVFASQVGQYADSFAGRLMVSGRALLGMPLPMWFGLEPSPPFFGDTGYAYALSRFGLPICVLMMIGLVTAPAPTSQAQRFKAAVLLYASMLMLVSGSSLFALKTAGIMWFLLGSLSAERQIAPFARHVRTRPVRTRPTLTGATAGEV